MEDPQQGTHIIDLAPLQIPGVALATQAPPHRAAQLTVPTQSPTPHHRPTVTGLSSQPATQLNRRSSHNLPSRGWTAAAEKCQNKKISKKKSNPEIDLIWHLVATSLHDTQ